MQDRYMISMGQMNNNTVVYSYGDTLAGAISMLELADFLPKEKNAGQLQNFWDFCDSGVYVTPGHHIFYCRMPAVDSYGIETQLYVFVLHQMDSPEEIPAIRINKSTIFGFDYPLGYKTDSMNYSSYLCEFDFKMNPAYCRSDNVFGPLDIGHRSTIANAILDRSTYSKEEMGIGVLGFSEVGLSKTIGSCFVEAKLFGREEGGVQFYLGRLPILNEENIGFRVVNPPEGFSL